MGQWISREADKHKCDYPRYALPADTQKYDIWECECGKQWIVTNITKHDGEANSPDPRERITVYRGTFQEYESWKSGPFPPGTK